MRKYILLFLLPFIAFVACDDDDDDYSLDKFWVSIATVENPGNSANFFLVLDNDERLWIAATNYPNYRPADGLRIIADYTILNDKSDDSTYDHDVKLNNAYNLLTKDVIKVTSETEDEYGDDRIGVNDMWIGSDFLNIRYYFRGYNKIHYLNLIENTTIDYTDNKTHLEFRHDANDDLQNYTSSGIVCFNLASLLEGMVVTSQTIDLVIHYTDYDGVERTRDFTYNFVDKSTINKELDRDIFEDGRETDAE